ncbi:hypothetical protein CXF83_09380 [Shewanella sp. Choline-02u-19]|nr:hypothetical protein CXF84_01995 [Shewanella sp. Bg11-22]PKI26942.1 hypothetical protein CXF83_09380 [Shewanella sp. Choline-02u-19]
MTKTYCLLMLDPNMEQPFAICNNLNCKIALKAATKTFKNANDHYIQIDSSAIVDDGIAFAFSLHSPTILRIE